MVDREEIFKSWAVGRIPSRGKDRGGDRHKVRVALLFCSTLAKKNVSSGRSVGRNGGSAMINGVQHAPKEKILPGGKGDCTERTILKKRKSHRYEKYLLGIEEGFQL